MSSDDQRSTGREAWVVGITSLDIEDHGLGDVFAGQELEFSLGLHAPQGLRLVDQPHQRQARHTGNAAYDVTGVVTRVDGGMVVDFGVSAVVMHDHEMQPEVGQWLEGRVVLSVHPRDGATVRVPPRIPGPAYVWRIEQVARVVWSTRRVEASSSPAGFGPSPELGVVAATTVLADAGSGYYLLRCHRA